MVEKLVLSSRSWAAAIQFDFGHVMIAPHATVRSAYRDDEAVEVAFDPAHAAILSPNGFITTLMQPSSFARNVL